MTTTLAAKVAAKAAEAQARLDDYALSLSALAGHGSEAVAKWANNLAELEGKVEFWATLNQIATNKGDAFNEVTILQYATRRMSNGADDSWSGRNNDVKRAHFDGFRSVVDDALYL